jgi:hypothetical protein
MPAKKRPGVTGVYVEFADEMVAELDALVASMPLGGKADHIRLAVRRHLDAPPAVAVPELPPVALPAAEPKPKRGRKPRKGKAGG